MSKKRVLFLCTGNSARSQIAEGLVNSLLLEEWEAYSAGTQPAGYVHPLAIQTMGELGINIAGQRSKAADEFRAMDLDLVITVCDDAAENCPLWLGRELVIHAGFPDPARERGGYAEQLEAFRQVRDAIRQRVFEVLKEESGHVDADIRRGTTTA
jgi:arsenate reductase